MTRWIDQLFNQNPTVCCNFPSFPLRYQHDLLSPSHQEGRKENCSKRWDFDWTADQSSVTWWRNCSKQRNCHWCPFLPWLTPREFKIQKMGGTAGTYFIELSSFTTLSAVYSRSFILLRLWPSWWRGWASLATRCQTPSASSWWGSVARPARSSPSPRRECHSPAGSASPHSVRTKSQLHLSLTAVISMLGNRGVRVSVFGSKSSVSLAVCGQIWQKLLGTYDLRSS